LLPLAGLAKAEDGVPAISLLEIFVLRGSFDQVFNFARGKLDSASAGVTDEVEMIRLADYRLISSHPMQLRLADKTGLEKDLDRSINRRQTDTVALSQQLVANLFNGRMAL
jgi:hypothetical protein